MAFTSGLDYAFAGEPFAQVLSDIVPGSLDLVFAGQPFASVSSASGGVVISVFVQVFVCT